MRPHPGCCCGRGGRERWSADGRQVAAEYSIKFIFRGILGCNAQGLRYWGILYNYKLRLSRVRPSGYIGARPSARLADDDVTPGSNSLPVSSYAPVTYLVLS